MGASAESAAGSEARTIAPEAIHVENLHKKFGDLHVLKGV